MKRRIKIYGERNTNTRYLSRLIQLNLDAEEIPGVAPSNIMKLQRILPGRELLRDIYFSLTFKHNLGWKHTRVKPASELRKCDIFGSDIIFLTITKNPYSWLLSLYRNPYHQYYREKPDFETFLRTPWKTVGRDNCANVLSNPVELWNVKNRSYLYLTEFDHMALTTEIILRDPKSVIDEISKRFSVDKTRGYFQNVEQSTKGGSKSFAWYQDYYLNERWRDELSQEAIAIINQSIDKDLMRYFGYELLA